MLKFAYYLFLFRHGLYGLHGPFFDLIRVSPCNPCLKINGECLWVLAHPNFMPNIEISGFLY